jgi:glutamine synthetase
VSNTVIRCEYVWLSGEKTPSIRSKTRILTMNTNDESWQLSLKDIPVWTFDGSSTSQASVGKSDLFLRPVFACVDSNRENGIIVLCDVLNQDMTPHETNYRAKLIDAMIAHSGSEPVVGFEQEYFLLSEGKPIGWSDNHTLPEQGQYYCGVGEENVSGRNLVELHLSSCVNSMLSISGINAEVAPSQWEYQVGGPGTNAVAACDHLWVSRFLLKRICEAQGVVVSFDPRPISGDWNGSGLHTNFSTKSMRDNGGISLVKKAANLLGTGDYVSEITEVYGEGLRERLTGKHETSSIDTFKVGIGDRTASVRVPIGVERDGKGYFEDRRPNSNADPYRIVEYLIRKLSPLERDF